MQQPDLSNIHKISWKNFSLSKSPAIYYVRDCGWRKFAVERNI